MARSIRCLGGLWLAVAVACLGQQPEVRISGPQPEPHAARARRHLAGRAVTPDAAAAFDAARRQHLDLVQAQARTQTQTQTQTQSPSPRLSPLNAAWQPVGPGQVASQSFGTVSGRVTAVAVDPADPTGNTLYVGTTGGGVWKSTNAAGPAATVVFTPLTDTLPVFSAGTQVIPSLSIGALSVANGIVLAGTGDPNDASDSYYGAGILRSADGGATWTLAQQSQDGVAGQHSFVGLSVAGFAWSSITPSLAVAAVGQAAEGVIVNAPSKSNSVMGLYFSTDAGVTWQMGTILDGGQIVQRPLLPGQNGIGNAATAVVWSAARQRFFAAVRFHGYYESVDGISWTRLASQPGTGLTATACPPLPGGTGSSGCPIFRGALAVQTATQDTFALTVDAGNVDQGLWQDVCALSSGACASSPIAWAKRLVSTPLESTGGIIAQADYNLSLAAVASGADTLLFAGTTDLYRCSLAAGCALRNTTNALNGCAAPAMVAPSQHAIATLPGAAPLLYVGNDGGVWRSVDGVNQQQTPCSPDDATHFQNLNSGIGSLAEVVSFAQDPTVATSLLAGLGENGTASAAGSATPWPQLSAGEGGTVAIDQTSPLNWYVSVAEGVSLRFCGKGSACTAADFAGVPTIGYPQVLQDGSLIDAPFLLDPMLASDVIIGTCRVWRGPAQSGATWPSANAISPLLGGPQNITCNVTTNPSVRSLAAGGPASGSSVAANAGSTVLYAGMAGSVDGGGSYGGHVFANYAAGSASATTVWTDLAKSSVTNDSVGIFNPGGFDVSSVVADPHDASGKTLYVTIIGFSGNGINAEHIYRSVNGGATWVNISSNLPNAPANAVLVDPNDANTLYVALDTGVYVTTSVTTCTTASCWSVYGTALPSAPAVQLAASAALAVGDGRFGELRVATYGRGIWQIPLLTAAQPAAPAIMLNPTSLTFAAQAVATASASQTITVTNSGTAPLMVTKIAATGDFTETDTCVGATVAPGAICTAAIQFLPTTTGPRSGVLTVYGNVAGGQATASLSGTAVAPAAIVLNPIALIFASTNVGSTSAAQNITISNTGGVAVTLQSPAVTGDFAIAANTCGTTLAPQVGCTLSLAFKPTASGTRIGSLTLTDTVGTQTASLSATGVLAATDTLSPLTLSFGTQQLNTQSPTQQVTLTNTGDATLVSIAAQVTSGDFTVVNGCGNSLIGHASCSLLVAFVPKTIGPGSGLLTVTDQLRTQTIALNGTGVAPAGVSLSPAGGLGFAATAVTFTSAPQTLTLTNNGGLPLAISGLALNGDFAFVAATSTCGASLAAGAACSAQVVFTPTSGGPRTGSLVITDNASNSPQTLALAGIGVDFTLTPNGSTTATLAAGGQAVYPLLLSSAAGVPGTVTFTCGPVPAHATCTVNPATPALGTTSAISVTVATSVAAMERPWSRQTVWLAGLLPFGMLLLRRRSRLQLSGLALLCLLAGCSVSRIIPQGQATTGGGTVTPTPGGTYNLVVSGISAGLTRSVGLTLVVQ